MSFNSTFAEIELLSRFVYNYQRCIHSIVYNRKQVNTILFIFLNIVQNYKKKGFDFVFYDVYCALCEKYGLTPSGGAAKIGFNRASVTMWKNTGKAPKQELLVKIADFFGVTTDYLLGAEQKEKPLINDDEELTEYVQMLKTRPECRMLFQLSKNATKDDVEAAVRIIEALRNK